MLSLPSHQIEAKGTVVPAEPEQAMALSTQAWETFVTHGHFKEITPRDVIARSWQQCRDTGVDPHAQRATTILSFDYIQEFMQKHELGLSGGKVLDSFSGLMEGSAHVIALADSHGQILYSVGQQQLQEKLERINFLPGASWSEEKVGPNGIGTPLAVGRPEIVLGSEHYCQGWQPLVCYGAPIKAPGSNKVIGVVDITGDAHHVKNENMVLTMSIAQTIEQVMLVKHLQLREQQREVLEQFNKRWPNEGLILFHTDGDFLDLNANAGRMLNLQTSITKENFSQHFPELWHNLQPTISRGEGNHDFFFRGTEQERLACKMEPFDIRGDYAGWLLILSLEQGLQSKGEEVQQKTGKKQGYIFEDIIGDSCCMQSVLHLARAAARDPLKNPVLIQGETGTGKEMIAQAIHSFSDRLNGPFIAINCGAIPADLVESELFGYEGGAFTGARRQGMSGKFEAANGGTLFLDEIDSMPVQVQVKLLRVLEDNSITRLGSHQTNPVDFRLITASGNKLRQQCEQGEFRHDLFHRLSVLEIDLPALRHRENDIELLAKYFLATGCKAAGRTLLVISEEVMQVLLLYRWPGNLRELHNLCHRWILTVKGTRVTMQDMPKHIRITDNAQKASVTSHGESLKSINDELIRQALAEEGGNITSTAKKLGIARSTLYRHIKK